MFKIGFGSKGPPMTNKNLCKDCRYFERRQQPKYDDKTHFLISCMRDMMTTRQYYYRMEGKPPEDLPHNWYVNEKDCAGKWFEPKEAEND